jgi:hypothetical protein
MIRVTVKSTAEEAFRKLPEKLLKESTREINRFGRTRLKKIYGRAYYTYFNRETGKTANQIKWTPMKGSRPGTLGVPEHAAAMDSDYAGNTPMIRNLRYRARIRQWVSRNWNLTTDSKGRPAWRASRGPKKVGGLRESYVKYVPGNAGKMSGVIAIKRRPWLNHAWNKTRRELSRNPTGMNRAIDNAFIKSGFKRQ